MLWTWLWGASHRRAAAALRRDAGCGVRPGPTPPIRLRVACSFSTAGRPGCSSQAGRPVLLPPETASFQGATYPNRAAAVSVIPSQPALTAYCHCSQDIPSGQDTASKEGGARPKTSCRVLGQVSVAGKLLLCGTLLHQCHASDAVVSCDSRKRLRPAGHGFDHRVDLWTMPA